MKKRPVLFLILILLTINVLFSQKQSDRRNKIAIINFNCFGEIDEEIVKDCSYCMRKIINDNGQFIIIDKEKVKKVLTDNNLNGNKLMSSDELSIKVGELLHSDLLIIGSISKINNEYYVELKLMNIKTNKVENQLSESIRNKSLLYESIEVLINNLISHESKSLPELTKEIKILRKRKPSFTAYKEVTKQNIEKLKEYETEKEQALIQYIKEIKDLMKEISKKYPDPDFKVEIECNKRKDGNVEVTYYLYLKDKESDILLEIIPVGFLYWNGSYWDIKFYQEFQELVDKL